jgi:amino acid adenylation domain-containing protein
MVVGLLGTLKAGGAYLPLDAASPLERTGYMLEGAGVAVALTERRLGDRLPAFWGQTICLDEEWEKIGGESEVRPENWNRSEVGEENLAYVIYTSGSSGRPKGVMITHGGLANYLQWASEAYRVEEGEGAPVNSSIGFDLTVTSLYLPLINGRSVELLSEEEGIEALANALNEEREYSVVKITPAHLEILEKQFGDREVKSGAMTLVIGGEELRTGRLKYWRERAKGTRLINEYGPTETVVGCCVYEVNGSEDGKESAPIGRPIANMRMYILDGNQNPAPVGVKGEIYISGKGVARGYIGSPELTGEKFIPNGFGVKGGERWYRTGDLGKYREDGNIEFLGRADDQVKIRGYRIELGEIEAVLNEHRSVKQSVVIAREGETGDRRLIGYVVGETEATSAELKRYVRERLPEYMVPESIVLLDTIPLTANGKIDRKRLTPSSSDRNVGRQAEQEYAASRSPMEEMVIGIFEDVLWQDQVGIRDNFFEIGGHSLLAIQVISRVRKAFGVEIGVNSVFDAPTAEALARRIEEAMRAGVNVETPPLVKVEREGVTGGRFPLSFAQRRLWFIDQLNPGAALYNIVGGARLNSGVNLDALERAINEIVRRHEILRTRFEVEADEPAQVIDAWAPRKLDVTDLTSLPPEEREAEVERRTREEAETGFDLSEGPLLRVKALKLEEEEHALLYTMHHIVSDGWSMRILNREVETLYQAYLEGEESPLRELEIQYADFAVWQRGYLAGDVLEREVRYWRERLKDAAVLELPADRPRPATPSHRGAMEIIELGVTLSEGVRRISQREGVTLFMTLMAAFKVVLMKYSGQADISVGTVVANRTSREVEGLIGFFVNTLVMRTDLSGNPSFRVLMKQEREVALGAYGHQEAPFEKLVEELNPDRDLSRSPLFQVMMILEHAARETFEQRGVKQGGVNGGVETVGEGQGAKFDLTLTVMDSGRELAGIVEYSQDLFEAGTIKRLMNHYANVLEGVVKDVESGIRALELLSEGERKQIIEEWNATEAEYPGEKLIHELFENQVKKSPEAVALVYEEQSLTYRELNERANHMAWRLREIGVGPESAVGLYCRRSAEMVIGMLGILKAGGAYAPLEPAYPQERLAYIIERAPLRALLADRDLASSLPACEAQIIYLENERPKGEPPVDYDYRIESGVTPDSLAYVIYTSGSTGQPKGVMISHRAICNRLLWTLHAFPMRQQDCLFQKTPYSFDASVWEIFAPLLSGARLLVARPEGHRDSAYLCEMIAERQVTVLQLVPSMLRVFLHEREVERCASLVHVFCGGEELRTEDLKLFRKRLGARLHNLYGPTEVSIDATHLECEALKPVTIGRPLSNVEIYVLDSNLTPTPLGAPGELHVGGVGLSRGYLNRPDLSGEKFIPHPYGREAGARLYKTGDLGRWTPEGTIEYLRRNDFQVKLRGFRIELGEIEAKLTSHPNIREAVVALQEDGEGGKRLVGYYTGEEVSADVLRAHLISGLPDYMVPVAYMRLESLPLLPNGKLDRRALPAPDMRNEVRRAEERDGYQPPRTPVEEMVTGIFEEVLKLDRVGRMENFFELGGHSLLATQVISRLRNSFGAEIGVKSVFEKPTAEGLSQIIEAAMKAGEKASVPPLIRVEREGARGGRFPLSFAQRRLWFIDRLNPGNAVYNNPGAMRLKGGLNLDAMEWVINEIIRRHEALRTRFEVEEGEPAQVIVPWKPQRLEVIDLTGLDPEERTAETVRRAKEDAETGFDLGRGPLLRVKVLKLEEDDYVALYTMHHIVSDAWSMEILIREIDALYQAYGRYSREDLEDMSLLPELPIQYADFAVWQREWLKGEVLEEKIEYWRKRLEGLEDLALPTDRPRPATRSFRGCSRHFVVGEELTLKLRELSRREGVTPFMAMLGGFDVLMSRYSGQRDIVVGTDVANRNRAEIEGLIGFFVNQLALRVDVRSEESFGKLLKQVREVCLEAYTHEDAPFEKLVEDLRPERDLSRSPLFQAKLIWQTAPRAWLELGTPELSGDKASEFQIESEAQRARFDLLVSVVDAGRNLVGVVEYSRDLFEMETIRRLIGHYMNLLGEIVDGIEKPISALNLLNDAEREQAVVGWNRTETPYMKDRPIHELFAEQAERAPDRIAVVCEGKRVSYRELDRRANQLASHLQGLGVGPETPVGVCLERSVEMLVAILGTLKAGGAYLPLDPEFPPERIELLLEDAGVKVTLTSRSLNNRLQAFKRQTVLIAEEWEGISGESKGSQKGALKKKCEAENLAYVIYTSGSTGKPKGVMVRHRSLVNYSLDICRRLGLAEDGEDHILRFATVSTITADLGNTCIYPSLLSGGCLHILSYEAVIDGFKFEEYFKYEPIDALKITPSHLSALLRSQPNGANMLPQKYLILGGESLPYELVDSIMARGGSCEVINHYGPTETTIGSLMTKAPEMNVKDGRAMSAPIGQPIANTRSYVLDRDFNLLPVFARGELQISGEGVARGYLGRPDLTAERFIPNPFSSNGGERLYRTGDLVRYLSDGKTEFLGRVDDQVKIRGYRVELGEIQAVLNEHRGVRQCIVVAREDERGEKRIVGYVAPQEEVTVAELKQYVREKLPEYMTPETILLLEEIPLTANGKPDRKRLPALSDTLQSKEESYIRSRDIVEHQLLKIWEDLLDIRPISVKDKFFDLGGHSILAAIMMAQIKSVFGREVPLYILFQEGTIERLATFLKQDASSMSWSCLVEFQSLGSKPPLFFVHPGGGNVHSYYDLASCLGSDRPFYAFQEPGLYKEQALFTSIEDMAAYYIEAMKTAQPEGPYFIGGWSFGGLVAFEMARQLSAQNQKVGQVLLLDSEAPISVKEYFGDEYEESEEDEDENKDDATLLLELMGGLGLSEEDLKPYEGDQRIEYILKTGIGMNYFPPDVDITRARNYLEMFRTNGRARRKYLPHVYQGSVTLFRPFTQLTLPTSDGTDRGERIARLIHDKGWSELAVGGVKVIEVPGTHGTMVGAPHVETLALRIRECLDEVETVDS